MTDVERFLRARIEEDEEWLAQESGAMEWCQECAFGAQPKSPYSLSRLAADCKARRELLTLYQIAGSIPSPDMGWHLLKSALYAAATVHAGHPDYKAEWATP